MTEKELLIKEIEQIPDEFLEELEEFLRFLKMRALEGNCGPALLSESALRKDWDRPEEDEAWKDL